MSEIWLPVSGYEGLYEVSNFGRVRSLEYRGKKRIKILTPYVAKNGYFLIKLCKNGEKKNHLIHRLVAEAFIPNLLEEPEVNHLDENKENNSIDNLEWCNHKYNTNYGTRNIRVGEKQSKPVLQLTKNGELVREWISIMEAERNGFYSSHIIACCKRRAKSHKGFIWKYKPESA